MRQFALSANLNLICLAVQAQVRGFLAHRLYQNLRVRHMAATLIQKMWRGYEVRLWYTNLRRSLVHFQVRRSGTAPSWTREGRWWSL